jgi:hypothetical protein
MFIMIPVAALVTFGGAFGVAWLTKPAPLDDSSPNGTPTQPQDMAMVPLSGAAPALAAAQSPSLQRMMSDQQLRDLVREVKDRIQDYETKIRGLEARERRLAMSQKDLQTDIDKLNSLRVDVASAVSELKKQRDTLEQTRIRIEDSEILNLTAVSKTLEGMDADSAGQLVVNICHNAPTDPGVATEEAGQHYAVKLLHLMEAKKRAKLFVSLVSLEPDLAGQLSMKLKRILEAK